MGRDEESQLLLNSPPPILIDIVQPQPQPQSQSHSHLQSESESQSQSQSSQSENNSSNSFIYNFINNDKNDNKDYLRKDIFSSPIFYSVFLGCFTFIVYLFRNLIGYNLYNITVYLNQSWVYVVFSIFSSISSPIIISRIKHKLSIILGFIVLFTSYLFTNYTRNAIIQVFVSISNQLLYTSIYSLIVLINYGSDFSKFLILIYFIVYYSLQITTEYVSISNFDSIGIYIALFIVGLLYIIVLPKPKEDLVEEQVVSGSNNSGVGGISNGSEINQRFLVFNESKKIFDLLPYPYVFNRETKLYYMIPVLVLIGITDGYLPFWPMIAAINSIIVNDLLYRIGRYRTFQILMVFGFISIISGFIHAISYHFMQYSIIYQPPNYVCLVSYSIFKSGIIILFLNMLCETIPKEKILSIVCTIRLSQSIGSFIFFIFSIGAVIYEIGWFILLLYSIFSLVTFMLFLKSIQINK